MPDPGFSHDWPWALPAACQPSLQRGVRGVSPRLKKKQRPPLFLPRSPPFVSRSSLFLSFSFPPSAALSLAPVLADPPYPAGGPSLPGRRTLLIRQAGPPYPAAGGPSLPTASAPQRPTRRLLVPWATKHILQGVLPPAKRHMNNKRCQRSGSPLRFLHSLPH